jgi:D-serine deaminase-like pyridoxal phosphate-dependent protein
MGARWEALAEAVAGELLPAMVVDLGAFERNVERHVALCAGKKPMRVATKSLRVPGLLRRVQELAAAFGGFMCFSAREACFLARNGFDDLLVAYPTLAVTELESLARLSSSGTRVIITVDSAESVAAAALAAEQCGTTLRAVICVDTSLNVLGAHLGVRRSPLATSDDVLRIARVARETKRVEIAGVLAYEALVAGVADDRPTTRAKNAVLRMLKRRSIVDVRDRRARIVEALRSDGFDVRLINGGGTGSLESTLADPSVTEVSCGSGLLKPHLFDDYASPFVRSLEPAEAFALQITRRPGPGFVTCAGGGIVASGEAGTDRLPTVVHPEGLTLLGLEGAGEVQTPLAGRAADDCKLGSVALFRPAKAGEPMERFNEVLLVRDGQIVGREKTYRGEGQCFG